MFKDRLLKFKKEKWVSTKSGDTEAICPNPDCRMKSNQSVLPCGGDFWFCANPKCIINRFSGVGYYIQAEDGIQDCVHMKEEYGDRNDEDFISGVVCKKCNEPITKKELLESLQFMIKNPNKECPPHNCKVIVS
ncbi:MAG: hypothetical protein K5790_10300 [Nitrosopumilus sp.]|uniref:hypothetical protein n=1 Tax=Nitrosopumilus sp. TaxID=2024843 RepID=UPI00247B6E3B|nr:hypothetical protein [Nitrosopumilus sp.]MCV0393660.1 hypothetical protein [Nitrosopumilus sp.]